jgi:hypothetical protein
MAGAGDLFDFDPNRVLVAVDAHFDDALDVAGGLALFPERVTRAAKVPGLAGGNGFGQRLAVHMRDHQHVARFRIGGDGGDEPVGVEFGRERRAFFEFGGPHRRGEWCSIGQIALHLRPHVSGTSN